MFLVFVVVYCFYFFVAVSSLSINKEWTTQLTMDLTQDVERTPCRSDWTEEDLELIYLRYYIGSPEKANSVEYNHSAHTVMIKKGDLLTSSNTNSASSSSCQKHTEGTRRRRYPSICRHRFETEVREDRYPFSIRSAVCECVEWDLVHSSWGSNLNREMFSCRPIHIAKQVLKREFCEQEPGKTRWIATYEEVPISCYFAANIRTRG